MEQKGLIANAGPAGGPALMIDMSTGATSQPQQDGAIQALFKNSSHPWVIVFHLLFRTLAFLIYLFAQLLGSNFILTFILVILMLAFDFWTVKNVTGRLLVGLRWWNEISEDGKSDWKFESKPQPANKLDSRVFWYSLYITSLVWIIMGIVCVLSLKFTWLPLIIVAILLNSANVAGYSKCEKDAKKKMQNLVAQGVMSSLLSSGTGGGFAWMGSIFGR